MSETVRAQALKSFVGVEGNLQKGDGFDTTENRIRKLEARGLARRDLSGKGKVKATGSGNVEAGAAGSQSSSPADQVRPKRVRTSVPSTGKGKGKTTGSVTTRKGRSSR